MIYCQFESSLYLIASIFLISQKYFVKTLPNQKKPMIFLDKYYLKTTSNKRTRNNKNKKIHIF